MSLATDIDRFFADRIVQGAIEASRETSPLRICYPTEVPVSRFLAWLLDPSEGHGLNGAVLRRLLMACWETGTREALSVSTRHCIAPAKIATQSFADVVIDREVSLTAKSGKLDVLVLVPGIKLLVAIENKVGARETGDQLKRYGTALKKRFEDWHRVLVYLDLNGAQPSDSTWIGLDYDWLIAELRIAEQSAWLGEEPRHSIREFRLAIDRNSLVEDLPGIEEHSLLDMVLAHPEVFRILGQWARTNSSRTNLAAGMFASGDARQRLFPVFCRRVHLWQRCVPLLAYAALRRAAQSNFSDLDWDPKRSAFYFSLKRWNRLQRNGTRIWPLQVMVREQFDVDEAERFVVVSYLDSRTLDERYVAAAAPIAADIRKKSGNTRRVSSGVQRASLRVDYASSQQVAASLLCQHLTQLADGFAALHSSGALR